MSEARKHYGGEAGQVREAAASEVKQSWHEYLDLVSQGRQEVVVTRYGKPVMKLSPVEEGPSVPGGIFGSLSGTVTVRGDIIGPTGEVWEADG